MDSLEQVNYTGDRLPQTLALAQKIADQWGVQLLIIKIGRKIKAEAGATTKLQEAAAVRNWINSRVRYVSDPIRAELVGTPLWTLEHGGDCDDMATLACAILQALGHKATVAGVQWKGRDYATHAVCIDWTAECVVDPVAPVDVESWPPQGYEVARLLYRDEWGNVKSLEGLFGRLFNSINKVVNKVIKPKTLLGKIMDPLGLSSRNAKLGYKIADVVGTAAVLATGAYAVGAAGGATGGFWATAGSGAATVGGGLKTAALWAGSKVGYAAAGLLVNDLAKQAVGQGQQPVAVGPDGTQYYGGGGFGGDGSGGGGGGGQFMGYDANGNPVFKPAETVPMWVWIAGGAVAAGLLLGRK